MHLVDIAQQWTDANPFLTWLRESPSIWAYPTVFFVHTIGIVFTAGVSLFVDARLLGAGRQLPIAPFARFFKMIWIGLAFTLASGLLMLATDLQTRLMNRLFPVKMLFVIAAILLTALLQPRVASHIESSETRAMRTLAAASLLCWLAAISAGKFAVYF